MPVEPAAEYGRPAPAGEASARRRSAWRGAVLWTSAILAVLAGVWFTQVAVIPFLQVRKALLHHQLSLAGLPAFDSEAPAPPPGWPHESVEATGPMFPPGGLPSAAAVARQLGPPDLAVRKVRFYLRLPGWVASRRTTAVSLLQHYGSAAVPVLREKLADRDPAVRNWAAYTLGLLGPEAAPTVSDLAAALTDPDQYTRDAAAWARGGIGPAARPALPALVAATHRTKPADCVYLAYALFKAGPECGAAPPRLVAILAMPNAGLRRWSCQSLLQIGRGAVPALTGALRQADPDVRIMALDLLGQIGPDASAAVPAIEGLLKDPDIVIRGGARRAIARIRSGQPAPARAPEPDQR